MPAAFIAALWLVFNLQAFPLHLVLLVPLFEYLRRAGKARSVWRRSLCTVVPGWWLCSYFVLGLFHYTRFAWFVAPAGPTSVGLGWAVALAVVEIVRRRTGWPLLLVLPPAVVVQEWVFGTLVFQMNISRWSHLLSLRPWALQYTEWTGSHGAALWVATCNALVSDALSARRHADRRRAGRLAGAAVLLAAIVPLHGVFRMEQVHRQAQAESRRLSVAVLQPAIDLFEKHDPRFFAKNTERLLEQIRTDGAGTHLVVLPESVMPGDLRALVARGENFDVAPYAEAARRGGFDLLIGAIRARRDTRGALEIFDAALMFAADGELKDWNGKYYLIPFSEGLPYLDWFGIRSLPVRAGGLIGQLGGLSRGDPGRPLETGHPLDSKVGVIICSEAFVPELSRAAVRQGAALLACITEDSWYSSAPLFARYLAGLSAARAIETRRAVVRSSNTGISCVITPDGVIHNETGQWVRAAFRADVPLLTRRTLYVRAGEWLAAVCGIWGVLVLAFGFARPRQGVRSTSRSSR